MSSKPSVRRSAGAEAGCYQAFILLGPVAGDYNGPGRPDLRPIETIAINDCDFGMPANRTDPWFLYNVRDLTLRAVTIDGQRRDGVLSA